MAAAIVYMHHPIDRIAHTTAFIIPNLGYFLFQPVLHDWCVISCLLAKCQIESDATSIWAEAIYNSKSGA